MASLTFILTPNPGPGAKSSRRLTELQRSDALSHAARISHARRKHKREQGFNKLSSEAAAGKRTSSHDDSPQDEPDSTALIPRLKTVLGEGKLDPFRCGQYEELPAVMHEGMEYVYEVLWPINSPALEGQSLRQVITSWRTKAVASPLIFHSQVVNAATLCYVLANNPAAKRSLEVVRLVHQTKAIRLVQEAINSLGKAIPSVALITCIMDMSVSGGQILDVVPVEPIPESPLFQAFNIMHYGRFAAPRAHFDAVIDLVHRRGGIEELPPELANPLQLADIDVAIRLIAHPVFPLRLSLLQLVKGKKYKFDAAATALLGELGQGFSHPTSIIQNVKLKSLITQACNLTAAIDQTRRGAEGKFHLHELARQSMVFEHGLLSLPQLTTDEPNEETHKPTVDEHIDEITRLMLMIYSSMAIFPSCPAARVKQRLSGLLRTRLLSLFQHHGPTLAEFDDLLLWTFVLGGVATLDDTSNREWYVSQISSHVLRRGLSREMLDTILHRFLYWDFVIAGSVATLWLEVTEYQSTESEGLNLASLFAQACAVGGIAGARTAVNRARLAMGNAVEGACNETQNAFYQDPSEGLPVAFEVGVVPYDDDNIWGRPDW